MTAFGRILVVGAWVLVAVCWALGFPWALTNATSGGRPAGRRRPGLESRR